MILLGLLCTTCVDAALSATFNSTADVPVTAESYAPDGEVTFVLNFAPALGTNLTVVKNTGLAFMTGTFTNLANGEVVNLTHNDTVYPFVAWYYGGEGNNDLVLLRQKTTLAVWGENTYGQIMHGQSMGTASQVNNPQLMSNPGTLDGKTIVQVAQGTQHCLILTTEGKVYSRGQGSSGKLGVNDSLNYNYTRAVNTTNGVSSLAGKTVVSVAAGEHHSLALCSDGTVSSWGSDAAGQLGTGIGSQRRVPGAVTTNNPDNALNGKFVTAIAAGRDHTLALCSDGTVVAWGGNTHAQLGDGSVTAKNSFARAVSTAGVSALAGKTVKVVSAGAFFSLALCSDGTVAAWGDNSEGQLGTGDTSAALIPVMVLTAESVSALSGRTVTTISAGWSHSVALCSDGTLAAWGANDRGQLGNGTHTSSVSPVAVSVQAGVSALAGKVVKAVSSGAYHQMALCSDGTLASWGENSKGQLGDGTQTSHAVPTLVSSAEYVSVLAGQKVMRLEGSSNLSQSSVVALPTTRCDMVVRGGPINTAPGQFVDIANGDMSPSVADGTFLGSSLPNLGMIQRSFLVINRGLEPLIMSGDPVVRISGTHAGDFRLMSVSFATVGGLDHAYFVIQFGPIGLGPRSALVTIENNDPDKSPYEFAIGGAGITPEIEIRESDVEVASNSTVTFGDVGIDKDRVLKTFTLHNVGTWHLISIRLEKQDGGSQDFTVVEQPATSVAPGDSTTFAVQVRPSGAGPRSAILHIQSSDQDEGDFYINVTANGVDQVLPSAGKETVGGITFDGVTLKAEVNAKGSERQVFFDYGTTPQFGSRAAATPAAITGSTVMNVSTVLSGLMPNTKYYCRVVADSALGYVHGDTKTFTTLNRPPVAVADSAVVLPGGQAVIPVLGNDVDVGDVLNIASFTQPPAAVGKVTKVGNTLVFTAAAGFAGGTFSYVAGDAYKGKGGPATVALTPGTCTIGPDVTVPSDSPPYELAVTANAPFGVIENVAWLSFVPPAANATSVTIIPAPNASKTERTATILVGGKAHKVTQSGVSELPALTVPAPIPLAAISSSYELAIPTQNGPVTYIATGLPKGLTLSNVTGKITGYPTEAKTSTVTVKAKNVRGESNAISFDLSVLGIPASVVGSHSAVIGGSEVLTDKLGGLMTMTVTSAGGVSGTLKLGTGSHGFTGRLNTAEDPAEADPEHAVMRTTVKRTGKPSLELLVRMNEPEEDQFSAELTLPGAEPVTVEMMGGHHVWDAKAKPAQNHDGYYTMALQPTSTAADIPQGDGFLTMMVTPAGGVKWSGQLADGTVISAQSSALWADGRVPLFAVFGKGGGSLTQTVTIAAGARGVTGPLRWHKKPQAVRAYADGFEAATLQAVGGKYAPPLPGKTLLNQPAPFSYLVYFLGSGIEAVRNFTDLDQLFTMNTKHVISMTGMNPAQVKITKMDVALGTFTGTMALKDTNPFNASLPEAARTVTFQGVVVPSIFMGTGYFLLPGITGPPLNVKTSAMTSGEVRISAQN